MPLSRLFFNWEKINNTECFMWWLSVTGKKYGKEEQEVKGGKQLLF